MDNIEKGKISASQLLFAILCYFQGSTLLTGFYSGITKQDSWIIVISGYIVEFLFIWCLLSLMKAYPGKNIIQIDDLIFGPIIGKIISLLYIFYFITITILNLDIYGGFVVGNMLYETPIVFILIPVILLCVWITHKGIENVVRYGAAFFALWGFVYIIVLILSVKEYDFSNLAPIFTLSLKEFIRGTHVSATIPYGDMIIFTMLIPYVSEKNKIGSAIYLGLTLGMISLLLVVASDIAVLGKLTVVTVSPTFEALRVINVAEIFSRMEILFMIVRLLLQFFKMSLVFYASVLAIAQICNLKSYKPIALVSGALMIVYTLITFSRAGEHAAWGEDTAPFFSSFFEFILPILTLIVLKIKNKVKKNHSGQSET